MSGVVLNLQLEGDETLARALDRLARRTSRLEPALKDMGEHLMRTIDQRFDDQIAPDQTPWEENKEQTKLRKSRRSRKILTDSKRLGHSIIYRADHGGLEVGTNLIYAAIHQFGGETGRRGARFTMPARPFLGVSETEHEDLLDIVAEYISGAVPAI